MSKQKKFKSKKVFTAGAKTKSPLSRTALIDAGENTPIEQELHDRDQHLRVISDNIPVLIVYVDQDQRIRFSNDLFCQWNSIDFEQIQGAALKDILGEVVYLNMERHIRAALRGHHSAFDEQLNFTGAGIRHVEVSCVPESEGEQIKGAFLFISDISHYKAIEQALIKQRDLAEGLIGTAQDIILVLDTEGRIVRVNPYFEKLTGYTLAEIKGKDWFTTFLPEQEQQRLKQVFSRTVSDSNTRGIVNRIIAKDGREPLIEWYNSKLKDEQGKAIGVLSIGYDITDRRHMELALQDRDRQLVELTDALPILIAYVDKQQRYRFMNKSYEDWFGTSRKEIIGQSVRTILGDAVYEKVAACIKRVLSGEQVDYEGLLPYRYGGDRYVLEHYIPHLDDEGKTKGYMIAVTDLTEFKRLEEKNQQQHAELARISRIQTMGEMASALAHELNQPLTAISSYTQTSLGMVRSDSIAKDELMEVLEAVSNQALRASEIIRGIRRLVKKEQSQRQRLDINKLIHKVVEFSSSEARQNDVKIELRLQQQLPPVFADEIQIQQVVLNLVKNGIEAMANHGIEQRELVISSTNDRHVFVSVSDSGPGLDPEVGDRLFDAFITNKSFGLGLGLAISRSIIEEHEGSLWWEHNDGGGTTFKFSLPVNAVNPDE